mmetsp:Transcript_54381/g.100454  ORF Transcript_54381/g.100454 Transcript_54381/m.100454 type:complete len:122 (-) Transcript_54381:36-401(-)
MTENIFVDNVELQQRVQQAHKQKGEPVMEIVIQDDAPVHHGPALAFNRPDDKVRVESVQSPFSTSDHIITISSEEMGIEWMRMADSTKEDIREWVRENPAARRASYRAFLENQWMAFTRID